MICCVLYIGIYIKSSFYFGTYWSSRTQWRHIIIGQNCYKTDRFMSFVLLKGVSFVPVNNVATIVFASRSSPFRRKAIYPGRPVILDFECRSSAPEELPGNNVSSCGLVNFPRCILRLPRLKIKRRGLSINSISFACPTQKGSSSEGFLGETIWNKNIAPSGFWRAPLRPRRGYQNP